MMSKTREEAVWKRVMAMSSEAPETQPPRPAQKPQQAKGLMPEQVMELLKDELADACTYQTLAAKARGEARRCLQRLSMEERQHYRKLEAVYYLMTGQRPCPDRPKAPCVACLNEELRKRYEEELAGAARYDRLAQTAGSFSTVFHCLSHAEERHAQVILNLLQMCL